jgi:uncharacterized membrane protein YadS
MLSVCLLVLILQVSSYYLALGHGDSHKKRLHSRIIPQFFFFFLLLVLTTYHLRLRLCFIIRYLP